MAGLYPDETRREPVEPGSAASGAPPAGASAAATDPAAAPPAADSPAPAPPPEEGYGLKSAIVDMVAWRLGFGTPIKNVEMMRMGEAAHKMQAETHERAMRMAEKEETLNEATNAIIGPLLAVAKPGSYYYGDLNHLESAMNSSARTQAFFGGAFKIARAGEQRNGKDLWNVVVTDPKTGAVKNTLRGTDEEFVDRFVAHLEPKAQLLLKTKAQALHMEQQATIAKLKDFGEADWATKKAMGIETTPLDKYIYMKNQLNQLPAEMKGQVKDWELKDAAGLKDGKEWRVVGDRYLPMDDGGVGILKEDRQGVTKLFKVEGVSWDAIQKRGGATGEKVALDLDRVWKVTEDTEPHEVKARDVFAAEFNGTKESDKRRDLLTRALYQYQEWAETTGAQVDDGAGGTRKVTRNDMRAKLEEIIKGIAEGRTPGGQAPGADDDAGSWDAYQRAARQRQQRQSDWQRYLQADQGSRDAAAEKRLVEEKARRNPNPRSSSARQAARALDLRLREEQAQLGQ